MDRPVTSRARGICKYYDTPRGCYAGDTCKFLHGADERLTPYDKNKLCKFYTKGHCSRGDKCWFQHDLALRSGSSSEPADSAVEDACNICLEVPQTYGLLTDCSHIFCYQCIKQWRDPESKSVDMISSGVLKKCPLCRSPSRFITPSTYFFPQDHENKQRTINAYKASMARVPCKYFVETSAQGKPCCPFGKDCFYQHVKPDGTPHVFAHGVAQSMHIYRNQQRNRGRHRVPFGNSGAGLTDPVSFFRHIFENPINNLSTTLDVIRASLLDGRVADAYEMAADDWAARDAAWDDEALEWGEDASGSGWEDGSDYGEGVGGGRMDWATMDWGGDPPTMINEWGADSSAMIDGWSVEPLAMSDDFLGWELQASTSGIPTDLHWGSLPDITETYGHESTHSTSNNDAEATLLTPWGLNELPFADSTVPAPTRPQDRSSPGPTASGRRDNSPPMRSQNSRVDVTQDSEVSFTSRRARSMPSSRHPAASTSGSTIRFTVPSFLDRPNEDEFPPLTTLASASGSSSSRHQASSLSRTPGIPGPSSQPTTSLLATSVSPTSVSRFSTVIVSQNKEAEHMVINMDDEDEDEVESEGEALILRPSNTRPASPATSQPASASLPPNSFAPQTPSVCISPSASAPAPAAGQPSPASSKTPQTPAPASYPACASAPQGTVEHNTDPPFVTDGRGRVVWSSTRGGRADRQASRSRKTRRGGSAVAVANAVVPTGGDVNSAADVRGRVASAQDKSGPEAEEPGSASHP